VKTLYQTIFHRRSVRKFKANSIEQGLMYLIVAKLNSVAQIGDGGAVFEIVTKEFVSCKKAPHYIIGYCASTTKQYINMGYCLQEMDLYIQSLGLGTLWLGAPGYKPNNGAEDYCIMLAFGEADGVPERGAYEDFSRIKIAKIGEDNVVSRAMRLAPSAMNSQPWKIDFTSNDSVKISYKARGFFWRMLYKKLSKIDIGIATKHATLGLIASGKIIESIVPYENGKNFGVDIGLTLLITNKSSCDDAASVDSI
jgi:hypothetical protein